MNNLIRSLYFILLINVSVNACFCQHQLSSILGLTHNSQNGLIKAGVPVNITSLEFGVELDARYGITTAFSYLNIGSVGSITNQWGGFFRFLKEDRPISPLLQMDFGYMVFSPEINEKHPFPHYLLEYYSDNIIFYLDRINYTISCELLADVRMNNFIFQAGPVFNLLKVTTKYDNPLEFPSDNDITPDKKVSFLITGLGLYAGVKYVFGKTTKPQ